MKDQFGEMIRRDWKGYKRYKYAQLCNIVIVSVVFSIGSHLGRVEMMPLTDVKNTTNISFTTNSTYITQIEANQATTIVSDSDYGSDNKSEALLNTTELSAAFDMIMTTYDKKFRPRYGGPPVKVELDFHVLSFGKIREVEMEYGIDFYFAQFWQDPRFNATGLTGESAWIELIGTDINRIWVPDTIFINSKSSEFHSVTLDNRFMTINLTDGQLIYHSRITLSGSCRMDLRSYPFDEQTCYLAIESYGHDVLDVLYHWKTNESCSKDCNNVLVYESDLANFAVTEATKSHNKTLYHTDNFSWAAAKFVFKRQTNFFILQVYLPCIMIVMVSWSSFWICEDAVPARASISVTTILTIITMLGVVNSNMPKVSYVKALDFYLFISFVFVFLSLVEYILVLNIHKMHMPCFRADMGRKRGANRMVDTLDDNDDPYMQNGDAYIQDLTKNGGSSRKRIKFGYKNRNSQEEEMYIKYNSPKSKKTAKNKDILLNKRPATVDSVARILFPIIFTLFNIGYWTIYLR